MPILIPITPEEEQPMTMRFSLNGSLNVGTKIDSGEINGSVNAVEGNGAVINFTVISEILGGSR